MLKVTPHPDQSLRWWFEQFLEKKIDMKPPYQRRSEIWSPWKQAHLIDSLINDFDVPKFYIANFSEMPVKELNRNKQPFAIIDGKQRLGAIFDFFADKIKLNPSCVLYDDPAVKLGGSLFSTLQIKHPHLARKIESFIPSVMNVLTDDIHKIEELFVRLNMGEAATGAERRNAMAGPIPPILRELAMHPFFVNKIRFATRRMQEHNLIAKLLLLEVREGFVDTKKTDLDRLTEEANVWSQQLPDPESDLVAGPFADARDRVFVTLERLTAEFDDNDKLLGAASNIPIYYWFAREKPKYVNELRDFVLHLTDEIKEAQQLEKVAMGRGDPELLSYYTMSRTTNDAASLRGRYRIFTSRFNKYIRTPGAR